MTRETAIHCAEDFVASGAFKTELARLIAMPTESQNPERASVLEEYLALGLRPMLESLGFTCTWLTHPAAQAPFLFAERIEGRKNYQLFSGTDMATSSGGWTQAGAPVCHPGSSRKSTESGMVAVLPTTRVSMRSTSPP